MQQPPGQVVMAQHPVDANVADDPNGDSLNQAAMTITELNTTTFDNMTLDQRKRYRGIAVRRVMWAYVRRGAIRHLVRVFLDQGGQPTVIQRDIGHKIHADKLLVSPVRLDGPGESKLIDQRCEFFLENKDGSVSVLIQAWLKQDMSKMKVNPTPQDLVQEAQALGIELSETESNMSIPDLVIGAEHLGYPEFHTLECRTVTPKVAAFRCAFGWTLLGFHQPNNVPIDSLQLAVTEVEAIPRNICSKPSPREKLILEDHDKHHPLSQVTSPDLESVSPRQIVSSQAQLYNPLTISLPFKIKAQRIFRKMNQELDNNNQELEVKISSNTASASNDENQHTLLTAKGELASFESQSKSELAHALLRSILLEQLRESPRLPQQLCHLLSNYQITSGRIYEKFDSSGQTQVNTIRSITSDSEISSWFYEKARNNQADLLTHGTFNSLKQWLNDPNLHNSRSRFDEFGLLHSKGRLPREYSFEVKYPKGLANCSLVHKPGPEQLLHFGIDYPLSSLIYHENGKIVEPTYPGPPELCRVST